MEGIGAVKESCGGRQVTAVGVALSTYASHPCHDLVVSTESASYGLDCQGGGGRQGIFGRRYGERQGAQVGERMGGSSPRFGVLFFSLLVHRIHLLRVTSASSGWGVVCSLWTFPLRCPHFVNVFILVLLQPSVFSSSFFARLICCGLTAVIVSFSCHALPARFSVVHLVFSLMLQAHQLGKSTAELLGSHGGVGRVPQREMGRRQVYGSP